MRAWFPQLPGTAGGTGPTGPTGATGAAGSGAAASLVFSPGGTAGGNVFTTEASLATATGALKGAAYTIFFDLSHVAGAYTFTTAGALALAQGGTWTDEGFGYAITFSNGTTLPAPPVSIQGALSVVVSQAAALCTVAVLGTTEIADDVAVTTSAAGAFINSSAGTWIVYLKNSAEIGGGSNTERALQTSGGQVVLFAEDGALVEAFAADAGCILWILSPNLSGLQGNLDATLYTIAFNSGLAIDLLGGAVAGIHPANAKNTFLGDGTTGKRYWSNGTTWLQLGTIVGTYASRPVPGLAGRRFIASDTGVVEFVDDGSAWRPEIYGFLGTEAAPSGSTAGYTFTNTAGGTLTQSGGVATIHAGGGSADQVTMADKPRTAGQSIVACLRGYMLPTQDGAFCSFGIHLRNPTTGGIILLALTLSTLTTPNYGGNLLQGEIYTNATTFSSRYFNLRSFGYGTTGTIWIRMIESGGNYVFGFSQDGRNFESAGGPAIAAGNTQAGFFLNPNSLTGAVDALSLFIG